MNAVLYIISFIGGGTLTVLLIHTVIIRIVVREQKKVERKEILERYQRAKKCVREFCLSHEFPENQFEYRKAKDEELDALVDLLHCHPRLLTKKRKSKLMNSFALNEKFFLSEKTNQKILNLIFFTKTAE